MLSTAALRKKKQTAPRRSTADGRHYPAVSPRVVSAFPTSTGDCMTTSAPSSAAVSRAHLAPTTRTSCVWYD